MTSRCLKFGYWPSPADFSVCGVTVRSLRDIHATAQGVRNSAGVHGGWIYAPSRQYFELLTRQTHDTPIPGRVFGLPKTHELELDGALPSGLGRFVVWCLGFFVGMRLTETDAGFLDAAPIEVGQVSDFLCSTRDLPRALKPAIDFYLWHAHSGAAETLLAALHALWLSEGPHLLRFEQYHYAYIAIDALWFVTSKTVSQSSAYTPHAKRIETLANLLDLELPHWPDLIRERNNAIHQGLFYGQPLGFSSDTAASGPDVNQCGNVVVEMQAFICRAIVRLLGVPAASYITSPCTSRQRHGLF